MQPLHVLRTPVPTGTGRREIVLVAWGFFTPSVSRYRRQVKYLASRYDVVVTNPPYMGSKNMSADLATFAKDNYPDTKSDLFAMFIERCLELACPGGQLGFMSPYVWMFIKTYEPLRKLLLADETVTSLVQLEYSGFDGATVPICTFTLQHGANPDYEGGYVRLADFVGPKVQAPKALEAIQDHTKSWFYRAKAVDFTAIPGTPIVYWLSEKMRAVFTVYPSLASRSRSAKGLVTANNEEFVRSWWEVSYPRIGWGFPTREAAKASGRRWFPYAKGGEFRRWSGNLDAVVNWEDDGHAIQTTFTSDGSRVRATNFNLDRIFRQALAWTVVTSGEQSFRLVPTGTLYDAAAGMCQSATDEYHLAVLNSSTASMLLATINPTLNLHPGYLGAVPIPSEADTNRAIQLTEEAIKTSAMDWNDFETSWDFRENSLVAVFREDV